MELVVLQWFAGPDTVRYLLSLPSAYLARLIWSHLPLLYYTHCVMVEDGIWKKIWLIRDRVYEQEKSLLEMAQSSFGFTRESFERSY